MNYQLLKELVSNLEKFENTSDFNPQSSIKDFMLWFIDHYNIEKKQENLHPKNSPSIELQGDIHAKITQLIFLMNRYLKFYIKKGFEGTALTAADDFAFLATLFIEGKLQKNELIEKNTMEFSSGVEVIRRLEKNELIESVQDLEDKRAKIVILTEKGRSVFLSIMPTMTQIGKIATANLSDEERQQLLLLLKKLNLFHNPIFHDAKKENIEEIINLYLNKN
jgi:DNA-binding MarR family transcriptional regulator